jgi:hypothetical protein
MGVVLEVAMVVGQIQEQLQQVMELEEVVVELILIRLVFLNNTPVLLAAKVYASYSFVGLSKFINFYKKHFYDNNQ